MNKVSSSDKVEYVVEINPSQGESYTILIETSNIEWSMEQYCRNRGMLQWRVLGTNINS